jgi:hypothetical protein
MEFTSYGQIFNAFGEKKKIFRKSLFSRRRRLIKTARRAPLLFIIFNPPRHRKG